MKPYRIPFSILFLFLSVAAPPLDANDAAQVQQDQPNPRVREASTHDQLSQKLRMAQQNDPVRAIGPAAGKTNEDPALRNTSRDLIKESTILCYRGFLTLVPKRAVIHQPEALKDRFEAKPGAKVVTWMDFQQANRGWIRTVEVTREQAMGQSPLSEELLASFQNSPSAVVATFKGGPISVVPYKEPDPDSAAALPQNATETTTQP